MFSICTKGHVTINAKVKVQGIFRARHIYYKLYFAIGAAVKNETQRTHTERRRKNTTYNYGTPSLAAS